MQIVDKKQEAPKDAVIPPKTSQNAQGVSPAPQGAPENLGRIGGLFYAINKPWLLIAIPLIAASVWLARNPAIITDNMNQPYALLAGPALVGSALAGYLIIVCFKTIIGAIRQTGSAFLEWRKKEGSTFWMVIWVFLLVSVAESGSFFSGLLGPLSINGTLGFAVAFVIDLVAVECMRARMAAVRMRDLSGQNLYLLGVIICSLLSAFANGYTSLMHFHEPIGTLIPWIMIKVAPWIGMVFPLLMTFLSFASDYTADQVSSKLDPDNYERQENTRIRLLQIQRDKLKQRVTIEREIDQLTGGHRKKKEEREFIVLRWLRPKKAPDIEQIAESVVEQIREELTPTLTQIDGKLHFLYQAGQANWSQIQRVDQNLGLLNAAINTLDQEWQSTQNAVLPEIIEAHIRTVFAEHSSAKEAPKLGKKAVNPSMNTSGMGQSKQVAALGKTEGQGSLPTQQELLNFLKNAPAIRSQIEEVLRRDPAHGYERAAQILGQNGLFVTAVFVKEVWGYIGKQSAGELHQRTTRSSLQSINKNSEVEPVKTVKPPVSSLNSSEQEVKVHPESEQPAAIETAPQEQAGSKKAEEETSAAQFSEIPTTPPIEDIEKEGPDNLMAADQDSDTTIQNNNQEKALQQTNSRPVASAKTTGQLEETAKHLEGKNVGEMDTQIEEESEQNTEGIAGLHFEPISTQLSETNAQNMNTIQPQPNEFSAISEVDEEIQFSNTSEIGEDDEDLDTEMGENVGRRRGNYYVKASDIALQFQCFPEQIRLAVENKQLPINNQLELSGRTDKESTPIEEWKIKRSSLETWVPPMLPKKRGRPTKNLAAATV